MKSAYRPKWKNPFFSYGSLVYETSSYPMSLICCFRYGISSGASLMTTVSPFFAEEFTFFGEQLLRTTSFIWDSHMPHIIPSIFKTVLIGRSSDLGQCKGIPAFFREYSETKACRTVFLEFDEKFEITYPIGVSKI